MNTKSPSSKAIAIRQQHYHHHHPAPQSYSFRRGISRVVCRLHSAHSHNAATPPTPHRFDHDNDGDDHLQTLPPSNATKALVVKSMHLHDWGVPIHVNSCDEWLRDLIPEDSSNQQHAAAADDDFSFDVHDTSTFASLRRFSFTDTVVSFDNDKVHNKNNVGTTTATTLASNSSETITQSKSDIKSPKSNSTFHENKKLSNSNHNINTAPALSFTIADLLKKDLDVSTYQFADDNDEGDGDKHSIADLLKKDLSTYLFAGDNDDDDGNGDKQVIVVQKDHPPTTVWVLESPFFHHFHGSGGLDSDLDEMSACGEHPNNNNNNNKNETYSFVGSDYSASTFHPLSPVV